MNFWTPTFHSWGKGLVVEDMPWYLLFDYVEVFKYDESSNEFNLHWRDDFNSFDSGRWHKASGTFASNSSEFHSSNAYTEDGNLVLKMEHQESNSEDNTTLDNVGKSFPKQPLHAKEGHADSIEIPPVHDAFVDSHLFSKHATHSDKHLTKHHEKEYIDHHDDYYVDREGRMVVDH